MSARATPWMIASTLAVLLASAPAHAVLPSHQLALQGRLFDDNQGPLTGNHTMEFNLYDALTGGNLIWHESQQVLLSSGYYSVLVGADASNPLNDSMFVGATLYMSLSLDGGDEFSPRQIVTTVPYAVQADIATNVQGGSVDSQSFSVNGTPIVDANGTWVGKPGSLGTTLDGLSCTNGQVVQRSGSGWSCGSLGDTLDGINCSTGQGPVRTSVGWGCSATAGNANAYTGGTGINIDSNNVITSTLTVPITGSELAAGAVGLSNLGQNGCTAGQSFKWSGSAWTCGNDNDVLRSLACNSNDYARFNGATWACKAGVWESLACTSGQIPQWNGSAWACGADALSALNATCSTAGKIPKIVSGAFACGNDNDTLAGLSSCSNGEVPVYNSGTWACASGGDTLAALSCSSGQVAKDVSGTWTCGNDNDTFATLAAACTTAGKIPKVVGSTFACGNDNDTLGAIGLTCSATGQTPVWDNTTLQWSCGDAFTAGNGIQINSGSINTTAAAHNQVSGWHFDSSPGQSLAATRLSHLAAPTTYPLDGVVTPYAGTLTNLCITSGVTGITAGAVYFDVYINDLPATTPITATFDTTSYASGGAVCVPISGAVLSNNTLNIRMRTSASYAATGIDSYWDVSVWVDWQF